jgi:uncharacterized membrane protein YeaQ/YmgE (transglycosylase-associated protein family)
MGIIAWIAVGLTAGLLANLLRWETPDRLDIPEGSL